MADILCRTNGNADPTGKPRVCFTCHPDDFAFCFDSLCEDLFQSHDCAVYYTGDTSSEEDRTVELDRCNLLVIPVTYKLLTTPNRAMELDFPYAVANHIPVLPILMESGIEGIYARADKFGDLQYLTPLSTDLTELSYREKLRHFLAAVLIDDETAARVRAAFDAYIFLSYRKKDRHYANKLMRLIHSNPECRDIAIWFDEFLTPGENFRESIRQMMESCNLFTLLVTPRLLEKVVDKSGEERDNYVLSTELPLAQSQKQEKGIDILAVEMEDTDPSALRERAIPDCVSTRDKTAFRTRLLDAVAAIATAANNDDPAHNFLIGLAYLEGIDVETDRERGLSLITGAAEQGLPEAMEKLFDLNWNGLHVPLSYTNAAVWGEKLLAHRTTEDGPEHLDTLQLMGNLAIVYSEAGDYPRSLTLYEQTYALRCKVQGEDSTPALITKGNMASLLNKMGRHKEALDLRREVYEAHCRTLGEGHLSTLASATNLADSYREIGLYEEALELNRQGYEGLRKILGENAPPVMIVLRSLADTHRFCGNTHRALELTETVYQRHCETLGEDHPETCWALSNLALLHGDTKDFDKQLELAKTAYQRMAGILGEEHPDTLVCSLRLANAYNDLGDREKRTDYFQTARDMAERAEAQLARILGPDHQDTISALGVLASALTGLDEHEEASRLQEQEYRQMCQILGENHPRTFTILNNLSLSYSQLKHYEQAKDTMEKSYFLHRDKLGETHPETITVLSNLAMAYLDLEQNREAVKYQTKAYELSCRVWGEEHSRSITILLSLAEVYLRTEEYKRLYKLLEKGYPLCSKVLGPDHPKTRDMLESLQAIRLLIVTKGKTTRGYRK